MAVKFNKAHFLIEEINHGISGLGLIDCVFFKEENIWEVYSNGRLIHFESGNGVFEPFRITGEMALKSFLLTTGEKSYDELPTISVDKIKNIAASSCSCTIEMMESKNKPERAVFARWLTYEYFYKYEKYSLQKCGYLFKNKRDHSTVLTALKKLKEEKLTGWRLESYESFWLNVKELRQNC